MSIYDLLKDAASIAQKADNIDLYRKLLDVSAQALDMQNELYRLNNEINELKKTQDLLPLIERHKEAFITLKNENTELRYCSHCWDAERKLIQLFCREDRGGFYCPHCKVDGVFDVEKNDTFNRQFDTAVCDHSFV